MTAVWRVFLAIALALGLGACATLRTDVPRVPSHALAPDPSNALGLLAAGVVAPERPSSFRLLESGRAALAARLALADQAVKTLDVSIAGAGDITYRGDPQVKTSIAGSGTVRKR